jgi:hypothetical protein
VTPCLPPSAVALPGVAIRGGKGKRASKALGEVGVGKVVDELPDPLSADPSLPQPPPPPGTHDSKEDDDDDDDASDWTDDDTDDEREVSLALDLPDFSSSPDD